MQRRAFLRFFTFNPLIGGKVTNKKNSPCRDRENYVIVTKFNYDKFREMG